MADMMAQAFADRIGATKRQVQIWTDAGVVACATPVRLGRGKQRLYDESEVALGTFVSVLSRALRLEVGVLTIAARWYRSNNPDDPGAAARQFVSEMLEGVNADG